jgi:hypothetical protein
MQLSLKNIQPFFCELSDLNQADLSLISKKEIISPFSLKYFNGKFIHWKPSHPLKLLNKSKSEL